MYGQMAKWVARIDRAERIPEYLARAFQVATSGRPGPVVLALPEDMLISLATVADTRAYQPVQAAPSDAQLQLLRGMLATAKQPLVLLGGTTWTPQACADLQQFAESNHLPVACAFRFQDLLDNAHPNYIGDVGIGINPKLAARVKNADLLIAIGPRLGEMTTGGYTLFDSPVPRQRLVHSIRLRRTGQRLPGRADITAAMRKCRHAGRQTPRVLPHGTYACEPMPSGRLPVRPPISRMASVRCLLK